MFYLIAGQLLWGKSGGFGTALYSSWILSDIIITQGIEGIPPLRTFTTRPDTAYGVSFIAVSMDHDLLSHKDLLDKTVAQQLDTFGQNSVSSSRKREEKKGKSYLRMLIFGVTVIIVGTQAILEEKDRTH